MCQASLSERDAVVASRQTPGTDAGRLLLCRRHDRRAKPDPPTPSRRSTTHFFLLLLFREQPRVRLTDACKYLGVAHSTAHRLLAMLAHHGFVQQEPVTRAYIAGPALVEVGLAVVGSLNVREQARPMMEELAAETGETVHLGVAGGQSGPLCRRGRVRARSSRGGADGNPGACALHVARQGAARPDDRPTGGQAVPHVGRAVPGPHRAVDHDPGEADEGGVARPGRAGTRSTRARPRTTWARWPSRSATSPDAPPPSRWPHRRVGLARSGFRTSAT